MARPANGTYRLSIPPIPWPVIGYVTDAGLRLPGISGPTVYAYSTAGDGFGIAPDCYATCDGDGHWTVVKAGVSVSGTCSPA